MIAPWRVFPVEVRAARRLSPSFLRVTFTGEDLDSFADNGFDQRFKLILPLPGRGTADFPTGPDWYARWRELPPERTNPIRTYTVRAVRHEPREVDVDFVVHGDDGPGPHPEVPHHEPGPALSWAVAAQPGERAAFFGPDARHEGSQGGLEFRPPEDAGSVLLAGDETAVPAIVSILERLPADVFGAALMEVPCAGDVLPVKAPAGVRVRWLPRDGAEHGSRLIPAVQAEVAGLAPASPAPGAQALAEPDVEEDGKALWEVPDIVASPSRSPYVWLAGEAGVIKTLRRLLVGEVGLDRRSVAFMGYWRLGRGADPD
ncbi:siderophore-interacting protein [Rhizohabitans arisaemae]|uniref:siderophore-interacting protein n=1 Tax=Rhizohabitans arisaemae TaxID=2720610 RepID=UPI0024B1979C|nr:siderophore-interacting protein [Rhizohabitans arisaemae]